jgi:hypothetical protein
MSANRLRALLVAAACACVSSPLAVAQAQTPAKAAAKAPAAAGPSAKIPAFPTSCFQSVATNQPDPFYAKLEAAQAAIAADRDRQAAINEQIAQDFINIDPMEKAQRMQQWMMSNPQEAMAYAQAAQAAPTEGAAIERAREQQRQSQEAAWNALMKSYVDARVKAYAPTEGRRRALAEKFGFAYSTAPEDLAKGFTNYNSDAMSQADFAERESISAEIDRAYKALCPQWWGANGKFHAYLKSQKESFARDRVAYLEKLEAPKLRQYAIMNTPAASYKSTAPQQAALEYLDLVQKVFNERDSFMRCDPSYCDGR